MTLTPDEARALAKREIESIKDLDRDVVRRIVKYLSDPRGSRRDAAIKFSVPPNVIDEISREMKRGPQF